MTGTQIGVSRVDSSQEEGKAGKMFPKISVTSQRIRVKNRSREDGVQSAEKMGSNREVNKDLLRAGGEGSANGPNGGSSSDLLDKPSAAQIEGI